MDENSLISFFKKNEYLFTILGVFLVLAFIFNTPQLIRIAEPQNPATNLTITQIQCSINGEISILNNTKPITQINCTGNVLTDTKSGSSFDPFIKSSKSFSFLCLLLALIVYLIICFNLIQDLRECLRKTNIHLKKDSSPYKIIHDYSILIIIPFIFEGAIWFFVLLNNNYPDLMPNAFLSITLTGLIIELIVIIAFFSEIDRAIDDQIQSRKRRRNTVILAIPVFIFGLIIILWTIIMQNPDIRVQLISGVFGISMVFFSSKWIYNVIKNRNLPAEVYEVD